MERTKWKASPLKKQLFMYSKESVRLTKNDLVSNGSVTVTIPICGGEPGAQFALSFLLLFFKFIYLFYCVYVHAHTRAATIN